MKELYDGRALMKEIYEEALMKELYEGASWRRTWALTKGIDYYRSLLKAASLRQPP